MHHAHRPTHPRPAHRLTARWRPGDPLCAPAVRIRRKRSDEGGGSSRAPLGSTGISIASFHLEV
jgi:hypothetical protein